MSTPAHLATAQEFQELDAFHLWSREAKPAGLEGDSAVAHWNGLPYSVKEYWRDRAGLTAGQRKTLDALERSVEEAA